MARKPALGNTTRFASTSPEAGARRVKRFALQAVARKLLPGERVGFCMRTLRKDPNGPARAEVWYSPGKAKAHYNGLMVCGSVWSCPVCSSKITERRRLELAKGIEAWRGSIFMATFTLQHDREDSLRELRDDLRGAYRALKSGRWWQVFEARYRLAGSVSGLECTVSLSNGWHPHLHVLFFSALKPGSIDPDQVQTELSYRFRNILERRGRYVSAIYGVKVEKPVDAQGEGDQALKKYISKWGLDSELAKSPVKAAKDENGVMHYSPFQLLELASTGTKWAAVRFKEYAETMKGSKQLVWSRGLRAVLGLVVEEKGDQELAEEAVEIGDQLLAALSWSQWSVVLANDARAELLNVADSGDTRQVYAFLSWLGVQDLPGGVFEVDYSLTGLSINLSFGAET